MGFLRWIDRHLWSLPVLVFLLCELGFSAWSAASSRPVLLAAAPLIARQAVYSSLTGSSSALLGLAVAAVAVIVAFGPRPAATGIPSEIERKRAEARTTIAGSMLAVSFFLLVAAVAATVALAVDVRPTGNSAITTLVEASGIAGIVGLLVGGAGLTLVVVERSRSA
jgi:hypothetical protein